MRITNKILIIPLLPLSILYYIVTATRNWLYNHGIFKTYNVSVLVISVGNITAGGTGKTPFVIALANLLSDKGYLPGIITRGYHRESSGQLIIRNRDSVLANSLQSGEEPWLIASETQNTVVIVDKNRLAATKTAIEKHNCDIIIADDAFQHRRLGRNIDIVLWDSNDDPQKSYHLPSGRLREPIRGLKRANLILVSRSETIPQIKLDYFHSLNPEAIIAPLPMSVRQVSFFYNDEIMPMADLKDNRILAFCGLGNPTQFFRTVESITLAQPRTHIFLDHYKYSVADIQKLLREASDQRCKFLVTTRKDAINLPDFAKTVTNLIIVDIEYNIDDKIKAAIFEKLPPSN